MVQSQYLGMQLAVSAALLWLLWFVMPRICPQPVLATRAASIRASLRGSIPFLPKVQGCEDGRAVGAVEPSCADREPDDEEAEEANVLDRLELDAPALSPGIVSEWLTAFQSSQQAARIKGFSSLEDALRQHLSEWSIYVEDDDEPCDGLLGVLVVSGPGAQITLSPELQPGTPERLFTLLHATAHCDLNHLGNDEFRSRPELADRSGLPADIRAQEEEADRWAGEWLQRLTTCSRPVAQGVD